MPSVTKCGIHPEEYWQLSLGDMNIVLKAENMRYKERCRQDYNLASMITSMIGSSFGGKPLPSYHTFFQEQEELPPVDKKRQINFMAEQWAAWADYHNSRRQEVSK